MDSITLSLADLGRRAFFAASASISALLLSPSASAQQVQPLYTSVNDLPGDEVVVMTNVVEYLNGNGVDKIASGGDVIRADRSAYARTELPLSFLDDEHGTGMLILNEYNQDRSRIVWEGTNEWASSKIYRFRIVYTETASSMEGTVYNHWSLDRRELRGSTWVSSVAFTNGVSIARLVGELGTLKMASMSPLGSVESYPISELASGVFGTNLVGRLAIEGEGQGGGGGGSVVESESKPGWAANAEWADSADIANYSANDAEGNNIAETYAPKNDAYMKGNDIDIDLSTQALSFLNGESTVGSIEYNSDLEAVHLKDASAFLSHGTFSLLIGNSFYDVEMMNSGKYYFTIEEDGYLSYEIYRNDGSYDVAKSFFTGSGGNPFFWFRDTFNGENTLLVDGGGLTRISYGSGEYKYYPYFQLPTNRMSAVDSVTMRPSVTNTFAMVEDVGDVVKTVTSNIFPNVICVTNELLTISSGGNIVWQEEDIAPIESAVDSVTNTPVVFQSGDECSFYRGAKVFTPTDSSQLSFTTNGWIDGGAAFIVYSLGDAPPATSAIVLGDYPMTGRVQTVTWRIGQQFYINSITNAPYFDGEVH